MSGSFNRRNALLVALLLFSAAPLTFLLLLGLYQQLEWIWALAGAAVLLLWLLLFLLPHFTLMAELSAYIAALRDSNRKRAPLPQPPRHSSPILAPGLDSSLVETAEERDRRRREIEAIMAGNESILASLPDPLIMLDRRRAIVRANPAAQALYGSAFVGQDLTRLLRNPDLLAAADAAVTGQESQQLEFVLPGDIDRHFTATLRALSPAALDGTVAILSLHDLTSIKRAERLRADFVANASHELRTPLASLLGFLETLRGPAKDDRQAQQEFLAIMQEQASRMARLVEDLLSLSRIEMQEHTPPNQQVDLQEILNNVVTTLALKARDRQVDIVMQTAALRPLAGDREELLQVFQNLVDNAIKYGRIGSRVTLEAKRQQPTESQAARRIGGPTLSISVRDQGKCTGLGLAIVKHIVSRHKGLLTIDSTIGQGSCFTVHLPLHPTEAETETETAMETETAPTAELPRD